MILDPWTKLGFILLMPSAAVLIAIGFDLLTRGIIRLLRHWGFDI